MKLHSYFCNCVSWDRSDVDALIAMVDGAIDISRRTFLKHVDRQSFKEVVDGFGCYFDHPKQGLTFAGDWAVSYHRSKLHGRRVYYFRWAAIEYVFTL